MRRVGRSVLVCGLFTVESSHRLPAHGDYAGPILAGVSNQGQNKREPYVTAGGRTYLIGTQDGNFPNGAPGARYYLNGRPVSVDASGIRMSGRKNHVLVVQ